MSSESRLIESSDLERLKRLCSGGELVQGLREKAQGTLSVPLQASITVAEETNALASQYEAAFQKLHKSVSECDSKYRIAQTAESNLSDRVKGIDAERVDAQKKLDMAIDESDIDTTSVLLARLPAIQLVRDKLEGKLNSARARREERWHLLESARSQLLDLRRVVDQASESLLSTAQIMESSARLEAQQR